MAKSWKEKASEYNLKGRGKYAISAVYGKKKTRKCSRKTFRTKAAAEKMLKRMKDYPKMYKNPRIVEIR